MLNVKAENLQENYIRGALTRYRAENEGAWLLLCPSGLTPFQHSDAKTPKYPSRVAYLNTTEGLQLSSLGQVT